MAITYSYLVDYGFRDGYCRGGTTFNRTASYVGIGHDGTGAHDGFFRFLVVSIPKNATIDSAYIKFTAYTNKAADTVRVKISCADADDQAVPTTCGQLAAISRTTAQVDWDFADDWTADTQYTSPDIKTSIQEVVDRTNWDPGNSIMVLVDDDGSDASAWRDCYTYDDTPAKGAELEITWSMDEEVLIAAGGDDGYVTTAAFSNAAAYVLIGAATAVNTIDAFFRFDNVAIPAGAIITEARVIFHSDRMAKSDTMRTNIAAEDADDPAAPINKADVDGRVRTTASVAWDFVTNWITSFDYITPDISAVIQEVVDRGGWASSNAIIIFVDDDGSDLGAYRGMHSRDASATACASLAVNYTSPGSPVAAAIFF